MPDLDHRNQALQAINQSKHSIRTEIHRTSKLIIKQYYNKVGGKWLNQRNAALATRGLVNTTKIVPGFHLSIGKYVIATYFSQLGRA